MEPEAGPIRPRPDYPPRTPPPPKRPPSPPPPQTRAGQDMPAGQQVGRGRRVMKNRAGAAWSLEAQPWAATKAVTEVTARLAKWGVTEPDGLDDVVRFLVGTVAADGGRHVSLHLAEQDDQALILAFSHQPEAADLGDTVLPRLHELGAVTCGTEVTPEGRQVWAVLDAAPRR